MVNLTAIFEFWHIADGNYPPLRKGQRVNLSFEITPDEVERADMDSVDSFSRGSGATYDFCGRILRTYPRDGDGMITVVSAAGFRFYIDRNLGARDGDRIAGKGQLLLDHYIWVEFLDEYPDPPDLFYQLKVDRIYRMKNSDSLALELDTMEGERSDQGYLLELSDEGVQDQVARTFI